MHAQGVNDSRDHALNGVVTARCLIEMMAFMSITSLHARRKAVSRANKQATGFVRYTLHFSSRAPARLRCLARCDVATQARGIKGALVLVDKKQLLNEVLEWASARIQDDLEAVAMALAKVKTQQRRS